MTAAAALPHLHSARRDAPRSLPIGLDTAILHELGADNARQAMRDIVRSVAFELDAGRSELRLAGPLMTYHGADPWLPAVLAQFDPTLSLDDVATFRQRHDVFDLCFEDSWTACFTAARLAALGRLPDELTLIHLDDHTDMMSTLLSCVDGCLVDPASGEAFDPLRSDDWQAAIQAGSINIANYLTPLYYLGRPVHIRHLNNAAARAKQQPVSRALRDYGLIPGHRFADIAIPAPPGSQAVGTYRAGADPDAVIGKDVRAYTMVHIDLDYFINDFNGASRGANYVPDPSLRIVAAEKLTRFFDALGNSGISVDHWMVATSPGFCCSLHWNWLLAELAQRIAACTPSGRGL